MSTADLNSKRFKFNGRSYFVAGSTAIKIGDGGEKRSPLGKPKTLDPHKAINANKLAYLASDPIDISLTVREAPKLGQILPLNLPGMPVSIELGWQAASKQLTDGDLKVVHLRVDDEVLTEAANETPAMIDGLRDWGHDGRVVDEVFIVVEHDVAQKFNESKTVKVGAGLGDILNLNIGGSGIRAGTTEVSLSPGSVMAYQLVKPVWKEAKKKDRKTISHFRIDQYGTG
jgi:hypothetical protein